MKAEQNPKRILMDSVEKNGSQMGTRKELDKGEAPK